MPSTARRSSRSAIRPARSRPGRVSAEEAAARHRRIIDAARRLFVRDGLGATSINAISRDARITKRTLYLLYGSKECLFVEVLKDCVDAIAAVAREAPADSDDLPGLLADIAGRYARALDNPEALAMYRLAIGENARLPPEARSAINLYGAHSALGVVATRLRAAEAGGMVKFVDVDRFAHLFLDLILAPRFTRWLVGDGAPTESPDNDADAIRRFLRATDDLYRVPRRRR